MSENNPVVFSQLSQALGVDRSLGFYDVYSIDDPDLLAFIPRPAYALLFTCTRNVFFRARQAEKESGKEYNGGGPDEPVIWYRQTIRNACGLIALLHGLSNNGARDYMKQDSDMAKLLEKALPLKPTERAEVLYNSDELEKAHAAAGRLGDTEAPMTGDHVGNHYICFAKGDDGHLWELNGEMKGPIDHGALADDEDMLSPKALNLGIRNFLRHATDEDVDFSIVAMAPVLD